MSTLKEGKQKESEGEEKGLVQVFFSVKTSYFLI